MFKQVGESGGWGGDAKNAGAVRGPDPLDSDVAYALPMEGPVNQGHDVNSLDAGETAPAIVDKFEASLVCRQPRGRRLLSGALGGPFGALGRGPGSVWW